jgi:hypothetical protein
VSGTSATEPPRAPSIAMHPRQVICRLEPRNPALAGTFCFADEFPPRLVERHLPIIEFPTGQSQVRGQECSREPDVLVAKIDGALPA